MEIVLIAFAALAPAFAVAVMYNRLVRARVGADEAWAQIDTQLQRRHDLIPNLLEVVKGYAAHERGTLDEVTAARAKAISVTAPAELAEAENSLTQAVGKLLAITESYPDLKADANFQQLQEDLSHTENMVAGARSHYNASVRAYDTLRQTLPTSLVASMFSFTAREYFQVDTPAARRAPNVRL